MARMAHSIMLSSGSLVVMRCSHLPGADRMAETIRERFNEIVEFSELGNFINVPVKNYSSGMKARLGFSIATVVDPEILILDEVLSVGDAKFRKKSSKKLEKMMKKGVTVLFVSHSSDQVLTFCNKAIILDHGSVVASGKAEKICAQYEEMISDKN